jgi:hypothetical protein
MQMIPILVAIGNEPTRANIMIATPIRSANMAWEHLTYAMSINTYRCQQLENLQLDHKEK